MSNNPLLGGFKKIPGISVDLPSRGFMYTNELTDAGISSGSVHVRPLSLRNEMALKTPDLLISGEGIASTIADCGDEVINAHKLYSCDVNTLLIAIRIATFGENMTVRITNPYYDQNNEHSMKTLTYSIDLRNCLYSGKSLSSKDDLIVKLDNGQIVTLKPLTFDTSVRLIKLEIDSSRLTLETDEDRMKFLNDKIEQMVDNALDMIVSVTTEDGIVIPDKALIKEWYSNIPATMYAPLKEKMDMIAELGPNLEFDVTDPVSGKVWKSKVPINPTDFFATGFVNETQAS